MEENLTNQQIQERILQLKMQKLKIYKEQPYRFLSPIGKMEEFLNEGLSGKYLTAFMSSANGTGKTTTIVGLIANICFPNDNPFFQQPMVKEWRWMRKGRIVSDTTTIKETIIPMMEQMIPKKHYTRSKAGKEFWSKWKMRDNDGDVIFEWDLMTYEQDPKQFESANLGIIIFDEPPPFSIYTASIARLKMGGVCLIFATPLGNNIGSAWLYQKIVSDPERANNDFFYMTASKEDGCLEHGVRGFLPHSQIEREMKQYPEEEILPRIFGEFSQVKGRVIKEYDEKIHVLDQIFDINKQDYSVVQLWDTHARVNEAIMWVAINRSGTAFIVDELWIDAGIDELVAKIKEIDSKYRIVKRLIDPSAFNVDKRIELTGKYGEIKGVSFAQILHEKYGLKYEPASKRRADGITMIREALRYNYQAGSWVQYPTLFVFPHCTRTRWEFINWMWDDWRGVTAERNDPRDKPQDKNDHCLVGETLVDTSVGQIPIKDLVGTEGFVKTIGGLRRFSKVRKTQKDVKVYKVFLEDGRSFEATGDHLILDSKFKWRRLIDYKDGDYLLDINDVYGYSGMYEGKNNKQDLSGVQRYKVLPMWKVFFQRFRSKWSGEKIAQDSVEVPSWGDTKGECHTSYRFQHIQQPDRKLKDDGKSRSYEPTWQVTVRQAKRVSEEEFKGEGITKGNRMAQVKESSWSLQETFRTSQEKMVGNGIQSLQKLFSVWKEIWHILSQQVYVLFKALQGKKTRSRIVRIIPSGIKDVYNLEVEGVRCFSICGGIVVHNCMENLGRFFLEGTTFTEPLDEIMKVDRSAIVEERTYF